MLGLMQDWPLLCHRIIDHAAINHADRPIVTRSVEGGIHSTTYAATRRRALQLAQRLDKDGMRIGDRVATLAWNTWRHLEAWYGIMGVGAVYHTVNPRTLSRADHLDRQSRRGSRDACGSHLRAIAGEDGGQAADHRALRLADRRRAHAANPAQERRPLRGLDRRGRRRFRVEDVRREYRRRHVLHLGHDRKPERGWSTRIGRTCCMR